MYDYRKLSGRIVEILGTRYKFAEAERTLSLKMSGKRDWKQQDICKAIRLLQLTEDDIPLYFFKQKVQLNWAKRRGGKNE